MPVPKQYVLSEPWVIREVTKGGFIRGNSRTEPMTLSSNHWPRLFRSKASAKAFLAQWRRGRMWADEDGYIIISPQPHRKTMQLEIIQLQLVHIP